MSPSRKELLAICKKHEMKGVSKKKKKELLEIVRRLSIVKENVFEKDEFIKQIYEKILDKKDPITLENIEEWTEEELKSGILLNQYFYKEETIREYIQSTNKPLIRDPIQPHLYLDTKLIEKYRRVEKKLNPEQIQISTEVYSFPTLYNNFYFFKIFLHLEQVERKKITTDLVYLRRKDGYYLGCIPLHINLTNEIHSAFEMRALDTMSTTDALLVRITNLYQSQKFICLENDKILLKSLKHLPKDVREWFTIEDEFVYINTDPIQQNQPLSTYNKLLQEMD